MSETELIAATFFIGALCSVLVAVMQARKTKQLVNEVKAAKANSEYQAALEGRMALLEKHVNECEEDRKKQAGEIKLLTDRNFLLTEKILEYFMEKKTLELKPH